jgi:hypothetical protein
MEAGCVSLDSCNFGANREDILVMLEISSLQNVCKVVLISLFTIAEISTLELK